MTLITKKIIQRIQKDNPEHYLSFKKRIKELKNLKKSQFELKVQIEKSIKKRLELKKNQNHKNDSEVILLGKHLDKLIEEEDALRFKIGMDKVNLNIPLTDSEGDKVAEIIKSLFGNDDHYEPVGGGYAALFKNEKK